MKILASLINLQVRGEQHGFDGDGVHYRPNENKLSHGSGGRKVKG